MNVKNAVFVPRRSSRPSGLLFSSPPRTSGPWSRPTIWLRRRDTPANSGRILTTCAPIGWCESHRGRGGWLRTSAPGNRDQHRRRAALCIAGPLARVGHRHRAIRPYSGTTVRSPDRSGGRCAPACGRIGAEGDDVGRRSRRQHAQAWSRNSDDYRGQEHGGPAHSAVATSRQNVGADEESPGMPEGSGKYTPRPPVRG